MITNNFPTSNLTYLAACILTDPSIEVRRITNYDYNLQPAEKALALWQQYQANGLSFPAKLIADQIRELRHAPIEGGQV